MKQSVRLFTGIAVPETVRQELERLLPGWKSRLAFERWPHPMDWHITLHFLGEMPAGKVNDIRSALDQAASDSSPFMINLEGYGVFGPPGSPSILWAGISQPVPELEALHARLASALEQQAGFKPEKRSFHPHLTIARKYKGKDRWSSDHMLAGLPELSVSWRAQEAVLYESRLGQPPMYSIIHRSPLSE
ncbi:RNA 2',3'-cyclic phosphodiesterase [Paenibacillus sambharensis]|uniref:RNA 2',3'-cyclic phosphodiesterase n=1 Tax=Paenibacillus sambharensis TaxID=1803190 RepID=A0A2W1LS82_9BACL|nr:RNA 2',3'-cyclic phosphodiesterase [Paenibacillus sambharensis]PZD94307.1 RNA 2',3'-cyclic phosphodiesterase [Paenibacillus sambharensis]